MAKTQWDVKSIELASKLVNQVKEAKAEVESYITDLNSVISNLPALDKTLTLNEQATPILENMVNNMKQTLPALEQMLGNMEASLRSAQEFADANASGALGKLI